MQTSYSDRSIAQRLFSKNLPQPNFMTPNRLDYGITGGNAWELSEGAGFYEDTHVYGVTFLNVMIGSRVTELDKAFPTEKEAREYIASLSTWGDLDRAVDNSVKEVAKPIDAQRLKVLMNEADNERLGYGDIMEIEAAYALIPDNDLRDLRDNATVIDMLLELEARL